MSKGDILQIMFSQSAEKIWWNYCNADFTRVWYILTC